MVITLVLGYAGAAIMATAAVIFVESGVLPWLAFVWLAGAPFTLAAAGMRCWMSKFGTALSALDGKTHFPV